MHAAGVELACIPRVRRAPVLEGDVVSGPAGRDEGSGRPERGARRPRKDRRIDGGIDPRGIPERQELLEGGNPEATQQRAERRLGGRGYRQAESRRTWAARSVCA